MSPLAKTLMLTIVIVAILLRPIAGQTFGVNVNVATINSLTNYTFNIIDPSLNLSSTVSGTITFTFTTGKYNLNPPSTYPCTEITSGVSFTCTATSNTLSLPYPGSFTRNPSFNLQVQNIKNPSNTAPTSVTYTFTYSNATIARTMQKTLNIYQPTSLTSCAVTFTPSTTLTLGKANFAVTIHSVVESGGSIQLTFPANWNSPPNTKNYTPIGSLGSSSPTFSLILNNGFLSSSPSLANSATQISLGSVFIQPAPSGTSLSFAVDNIMSPPTTSALNYVTVTTMSADNSGSIDQSSCSVTISNKVLSISLSPTDLTLVVGRNSSLSISFTAPQLLVANDVVVMSLRTNSLGLVQLTTYSIIGISVNSDGLTASSLNYSQINMTFNGDTSISAGTDAILNLGLFAQPIVNSGVRYLDFTFYRGASFASGSVSLTVIPNVLQQVTLVPHTLVVSQVTTYTFTILTTNTIDVSGSIVITLPTDVSIANGACSASMTSSSSSLNTCTCNAMNNVITLSSFNLLVLSGSSLITMAVDNIRNPTTTKLTGQFLLRTYYNSSLTTDPVDDSSATSLFFTPVAATIIQASIVPSNYQVYTSAVYTFTVRVNTLFPANGVLILYLPAEITVPASTPSVTVSWVYSNGTTVPAFSATCSVPTAQTYKSQPTNALTISQISASSLASGTTMTVAVNSLINPQSFKPSSSFGIVTMSPNGFEVEELGPILTVTMNVTNAFKILSATNIPASLVNGKAIVYSFLIQTAVPLSLNDLLRVQLATTTVDTQMILTSSNTCSQTYNGVTSVAICSPSGSYIFDLSLSIPVPKDGSFTISVDSIVLPRTLKQPGLITVWSYHVETPTNTKYSVSTLSFLPPNNNSPNVLKSITLSINTSPSQLNQQQQFTVTVTTTNGLYAGDYLVVVVPSSYSSTLITAFSPTVPYDSSELDQSLCASVLYFCSNYNGLRAYIKVEQLVAGSFSNTTSIAIPTKAVYRSPLSFTFSQQTFSVKTYCAQGTLIDTTDATTNTASAVFYLSCSNIVSHHCALCYANSTCKSCYIAGSGYTPNVTYDGYVYSSTDGRCLTECGNGYFTNTLGVCAPCDVTCEKCSVSSTSCTSCNTSSSYNKFDAVNKACLTACPIGFYADSSSTCVACSNTCRTCAVISTNCTSCIGVLYLSGTTCVDSSSCGYGKYANSLTNNCSLCGVSCTTCLGSANNCTACSAGYIYLNNLTLTNTTFACTNICPTGTVNDTVHGCYCQAPCATCVTTIDKCLSCTTGNNLLNNVCLPTCPSSTYASGGSCVSCPANCDSCSSPTCQQCIGTYWVSQGSCVTTCLSNYIATIIGSIRTCVQCTSGCLSCLNGVQQCTTCQSTTMIQSNATGTYCVSVCDSSHVNFNNTQCLTSCPTGYINSSNSCQTNNNNNNNTNNNTNNSTLTTLSSSKLIPFPILLTLGVVAAICMSSKIALPETIMPCALCAMAGVLQVASWIVLIVVWGLYEPGESAYFLYLLLAAIGTNLLLNVLNIVFFSRYVWSDSKFQQCLLRLRKTCFGRVMIYMCCTVAVILSHKHICLLFSNLFGSKFFKYKVSSLSKLTPLNVVRYCSLVPSILALAAGGVLNYGVQSLGTASVVFIQSIDSIVVTLLALVFAVWVTIRQPNDYENDTQEMETADDNFANSQLEHDLNAVIVEYGGRNAKTSLFGRKYYHNSSPQRTEDREDPLSKRKSGRVKGLNPLGGELNQEGANPIGDKINETLEGLAMLNSPRSHLLAINPSKMISVRPKVESNQDISEIQLEIDDGLRMVNNDRQSEKKLSEKQKRDIRRSIESKLSPQQRTKTKVIRKIDQIPLRPDEQEAISSDQALQDIQNDQSLVNKQEKLAELSEKRSEELSFLSEQDKQIVSEIKDALSVLHERKVDIGQYLLYLDIIEEMENQDDEEDLRRSEDRQENKLSPHVTTPATHNELSKLKALADPEERRASKMTKGKKEGRRKQLHPTDDTLVVHYQNGTMSTDPNYFDQEDQPQLPSLAPGQAKHKELARSGSNKSAETVVRGRIPSDMLEVNLLHKRSPGNDFEGGNILRSHDSDAAPHLKSRTLSKRPKESPGMGLAMNSLPIADGVQLARFDGLDDDDLTNEISPSNFDAQNLRIDMDSVSEAPTKPKVAEAVPNRYREEDEFEQDNARQIRDDEENQAGYDRNSGVGQNIKTTNRMGRNYNENRIDYDSIVVNQARKDRLKELQEIYLTRNGQRGPKRRRNRNSRLDDE